MSDRLSGCGWLWSCLRNFSLTTGGGGGRVHIGERDQLCAFGCMGVDNFFVVGGLCCHAQFCDHSYLLLDYHPSSDVINKLSGSSLFAKMKVLYQGLI